MSDRELGEAERAAITAQVRSVYLELGLDRTPMAGDLFLTGVRCAFNAFAFAGVRPSPVVPSNAAKRSAEERAVDDV